MREVGGDAVRWGDMEHLVATVIDVLAQGNWMYASMHSKRQPAQPLPLRRPGMPDPIVRLGGKKAYSPAEMDAIWAEVRARGGD